MKADLFRVEQAVTAVREEPHSHRFVSIPPGSTLAVVERPAFGFGLVKAEWNGQVVEVFLRDLQECAVRVSEKGNPFKRNQAEIFSDFAEYGNTFARIELSSNKLRHRGT